MNIAPSSLTRKETIDRARAALSSLEFKENLKETIAQSKVAIARLEQLRRVNHDSLTRPMTR